MILLSSLFYNSIVLPKLLKLLFSFVSWYQHFSFSGKISYCGDQTIWNFLEFFVSFLQIRKKCENFGNFTKIGGNFCWKPFFRSVLTFLYSFMVTNPYKPTTIRTCYKMWMRQRFRMTTEFWCIAKTLKTPLLHS